MFEYLFIITTLLQRYFYDVPKSVITDSVTCSTGNTITCAFRTKGISDAMGKAVFKKLSYNTLALYYDFNEI